MTMPVGLTYRRLQMIIRKQPVGRTRRRVTTLRLTEIYHRRVSK